MQRVTVIFGTLMALIVGPSSAWAQRQLTLDEALEIAKKRNRDLHAAESRRLEAETSILQARAGLLPIASAQGKYTHNYKEVTFDVGASLRPFKPLGDALVSAFPTGTAGVPNSGACVDAGGNFMNMNPNGTCQLAQAAQGFDQGITQAINTPPVVIQRSEQLDGLLQVTVPVIVPSAWATYSASKRTAESAAANLETSLTTILVQVAQSFYAAAGADELIKVRQHAIQVAKETLDNAQARFSTGVVNRVEVTRAELALVRAQQSLVEALDTQSQVYRALATLLDDHDPFHVEPPAELGAQPKSSPEIAQAALSRRPEIAALEKTLASLDAQESAAAWKWSPSLSAFGNARAFNYVGFSGDKYSWAVGAQIDWALYDGGTRDAQRALAQAQHSESEAQLSLLRDQIADEIANAARVADTKRKALDTAKRSVDLSAETLDLVRAQHDAGTVTQIDLLTAQDNLVAAEVAVAQARFDLALADIAFERAAGLFPKKE
jgi:OMF family outer membrane factor